MASGQEKSVGAGVDDPEIGRSAGIWGVCKWAAMALGVALVVAVAWCELQLRGERMVWALRGRMKTSPLIDINFPQSRFVPRRWSGGVRRVLVAHLPRDVNRVRLRQLRRTLVGTLVFCNEPPLAPERQIYTRDFLTMPRIETNEAESMRLGDLVQHRPASPQAAALWAQDLLEFARNTSDAATAVAALGILYQGQGCPDSVIQQAHHFLVAKYLSAPELLLWMELVGEQLAPTTAGRYHEPTLQHIAQHAEARSARALASFHLARLLALRANADDRHRVAIEPNEDHATRKEACDHLSRVCDDFPLMARPELQRFGPSRATMTLRDGVVVYPTGVGVVPQSRVLQHQAQKLLHELQYCWIGCLAPETEGYSGSGQRRRLRDYRGKTTVLVFTRRDRQRSLDQVNSLQQQFGDRIHVVVVSDSTDPDTGRSDHWWDGPRGPVAEQWSTMGDYSWFVLDPVGRIRYRGDVDDDYARIIATLTPPDP